MKQKKLVKKLLLNKVRIAYLNNSNLDMIRAGGSETTEVTRPTNCDTCPLTECVDCDSFPTTNTTG